MWQQKAKHLKIADRMTITMSIARDTLILLSIETPTRCQTSKGPGHDTEFKSHSR